MNGFKVKLIIMFFLQFAVLGSFIISLGGYLASKGMGEYIGIFYIIGGFVNIAFPALFGIIADRYIAAQKLYGYTHLLLSGLLFGFALYLRNGIDSSNIAIAIGIFSLISCLYYPTIALSFSISITSLQSKNMDVKSSLPPIRMFGTIGFVFAMLTTDILGVQFSNMQFTVGAVFSLILAIWSYFIPNCSPKQDRSFGGIFSGLKLLKNIKLAVFFFFVLCAGITLKISEAYINPYFASLNIEHPNILISLSRISETLCILLIPICLKSLGIRKTIMIAILAWAIHFGTMAFGNYINALWPLIIGIIVYGIAFDFFNITGMIYVDSLVDPSVRSTVQGLFAMFTNGFGAILGSLVGQQLFNRYVFLSEAADWTTPWGIISMGCIILLILFIVSNKFAKGTSSTCTE